MTILSRRSFLKNSASVVVGAGFISPAVSLLRADEVTMHENAAIGHARDARRSRLSSEIGQLIGQLSATSPAKRISWLQANRGAFFFAGQDIRPRLDEIHRRITGRKADIVATADRLLRHEFDILGSGLTPLGPVINWQRDFKSGKEWSNGLIYPPSMWHKAGGPPGGPVFHGPLYSVDGPADLKVPWDLSSFYHFPTLAEAFWLTGQDKYAAEVFDELDDWHKQNPLYYGVNWTNAMAVGLRLANVVYALRLLENCPQWLAFYGETGVVSQLQHLQFILDALEVFPSGARNNHYLSDLAGLAFGGGEIAGHPAGQDLLDFVRDEFGREMSVQFLPDGANFEGTIPYTRFSAECAVLTHILLERNGRVLQPELRQEFQRLLHFIGLYTKPNGLAPQVGDADNGRILVLHDYGHQEYRDHRHILAVGAAWLGMEPLHPDVAEQAPDTLWLLGKNPPASQPMGSATEAGLYPDGGFAAAKTTDASLMVRAGRIHPVCGGGHNHCDQLSFEYHDRCEDLIIDCGTMVYGASGALRNEFRSTAAHNTLQLDELEQQAFNPRKLFGMEDRAHAVVDYWEAADGVVQFSGHHSAYLSSGWQVARDIYCDLKQGRCDIHDTVKVAGEKTQGNQFCGRLHFAWGIQVKQTAPHLFELQSARQRWQASFSGNLEMTARPGRVSPSYGVMHDAMVIEYRFPAVHGQKADIRLRRA